MTTTSRFKGLSAAVRERQAEGMHGDLPGERRRGRPGGKRTDPDFVQVTAYIHKDTHRDAKIALLTEASGRDFSDLVQDLLAEWLMARG